MSSSSSAMSELKAVLRDTRMPTRPSSSSQSSWQRRRGHSTSQPAPAPGQRFVRQRTVQRKMKRQLKKQGLKKQLSYTQRQRQRQQQEEERAEDDEGARESRGTKRTAAAAVPSPAKAQTTKKQRSSLQPSLPAHSSLTSSTTRFFDLLSSSSSSSSVPSTSSTSRADEAELSYLEEKLGLAHSSSSATKSKLRREMEEDGLGELFDLVDTIQTGLTPHDRLRIARQEGLMEEMTAAEEKEAAATTARTSATRAGPSKRRRKDDEDDEEEGEEGEEEEEEGLEGENGEADEDEDGDSEVDPDDDDQLLPEPDAAEMRRYYPVDDDADEEGDDAKEGAADDEEDADDWPADDGEGDEDDGAGDDGDEEEKEEERAERSRHKPTRDELYGFNAPLPQSLLNFRQGQPLTSPSTNPAASSTGTGKYVPPHLRNKTPTSLTPSSSSTPSSSLSSFLSTPPPDPVLLPIITGVLNRVTPDTIEPLTTSLLSLFSSHPRAAVTSTLTHSLLTSILTTHTPPTPTYLLSTSGLLALLHFTSPHPTLAYLVEHLLLTLHSLLHSPSPSSSPSSPSAPSFPPSPLPLLSLLSHLLLFDCVSPSLLLSLLHSFASPLTLHTLPLLTSTLTLIGPHLRRADPASIKTLVQAIHRQARDWQEEGGEREGGGEGEGKVGEGVVGEEGDGMGGRVEYLLSLVSEVKNNRVRGEGLADAVMPIKRALVAAVKRRVGKRGGWDETKRLAFGYQDVLDIPEKGRWWVVGAAYKGRGAGERGGEGESAAGAEARGRERVVDEEGEVDYVALAHTLGYHAALEVRLFCTLTSSSDYLHCVEGLDKLRLRTGAQHRALVSIVLDCVRRSRQHNPYYTLVMLHLLQHVRPMRFTLQLALWDTLTALEGGEGVGEGVVAGARNVGRFVAGVMVGGGVHAPSVWAVLKHVEWEGMGVALQALLWAMMDELLGEEATGGGERLQRVFGAVGREKGDGKEGQGVDERRVRTGLLHFLDAHATPQSKRTGWSRAERDRDVRVQRVRQAIAE